MLFAVLFVARVGFVFAVTSVLPELAPAGEPPRSGGGGAAGVNGGVRPPPLYHADDGSRSPSPSELGEDKVTRAQLVHTAVRCTYADTTDITVCGRRAADRFRLPLVIEREPDRRDLVRDKTRDLLRRMSPIEAHSPFLVGGGTVGVTATVGMGADADKPRVAGQRPLAP